MPLLFLNVGGEEEWEETPKKGELWGPPAVTKADIGL